MKQDQNTIGILLVSAILCALAGAILYPIISPYVSSIFHPREPKLEITLDVIYVPLNNSKNLSLIKFIRNNETITEYSATRVPYCKVEIKNNGEEVAVINKLTVEVLEVKPYIICRPLFPSYNYSIYLNTTDILLKLNLSNYITNNCIIKINPPYFQDLNLSPHFEVSSNDVESFGLYIITNFRAEYRIKLILHYDGKTAESRDVKIEVV